MLNMGEVEDGGKSDKIVSRRQADNRWFTVKVKVP